jgi:hypothetical protein
MLITSPNRFINGNLSEIGQSHPTGIYNIRASRTCEKRVKMDVSKENPLLDRFCSFSEPMRTTRYMHKDIFKNNKKYINETENKERVKSPACGFSGEYTKKNPRRLKETGKRREHYYK